MPTIDYDNVGEVLKHEFLRGVIQTVDSATDTCTVTVAGRTVDALLFYHCTPESAIRDNGAIEGAAAGFAADDAVIVQTNRNDPTEYLVVAHLDGVRSCGLRLRLWTAKGALVEDSYKSALHIYIVNSRGESISSDYFSYEFKANKDDAAKGYWQVTVEIAPEMETEKYWVSYAIGGKHLFTQYPHRYGQGSSLFYQVGDLIPLSGLYEDTFHYLEATETMSPWPEQYQGYVVRPTGGGAPVFESGGLSGGWAMGYGALKIGNNTSVTFTITVTATVPVKIKDWKLSATNLWFTDHIPAGWVIVQGFSNGAPNPLPLITTEYSDGYSLEQSAPGMCHGYYTNFVYDPPERLGHDVIVPPSMAGSIATMTITFALVDYTGTGGACVEPEEGSSGFISTWSCSFTDIVFFYHYYNTGYYPCIRDEEDLSVVLLNPLKQTGWSVSMDVDGE